MIWAVVGIGGIVANIVVSLQADRMAHRRRLGAMAHYFEHVLVLPFSFHNTQHSGRLLKIMLTGVDHLFGIWLSFFRENLATFVALFIMLPLSLFMNWRLGSLLIVLIVFFAIANAWVVGKTDRLQAQVEEYHSELAGRAGDALGNIHLIQSFVRLGAETGEMHRIIRRTLEAQYPVLNWWALLSVLTRAASTVTVISIFVLGTWLYTQDQATVGEIVSFMGFATMLIGRMDQASGFVSRIFFQMPALADFFRVLDHQSTVLDKPNGKDIGRAKGNVDFEDVSFSYDGLRPALVHFTLHVPAGHDGGVRRPDRRGQEHGAVAAASHVGPAVGRDPHRRHRPSRHQARIASPQHRRGVPGFDDVLPLDRRQSADRQARRDAGRARGRRPGSPRRTTSSCASRNGYETLVGERGTTLSGGERQRLAIARALLKNPPILILDEATSALDAVTEARIQKALKVLMQGRTTFVIAHRLSTIRDADQVVVLEHGSMAEHGSYAELMARGGVFAGLVATQRAGIESA